MCANIKATQTRNSDEWATPRWLFDTLHAEFDFNWDVAASPENAKLPNYYHKDHSGLDHIWHGRCFMNPPYSQISVWMKKAHDSAYIDKKATVVCLVPARVDTRWWWDYARWGEVRFLKGRLRFGDGKTGAPFPSAVIVFARGFLYYNASTHYWNPPKIDYL